MVTYKDIINEFKTFTQNHTQINDYDFGDISNIQSNEFNFPLVFLNPIGGVKVKNITTLNFDMYVLDVVEQDRTNTEDVLTNTLIIGNDIVSQFWLDRDESLNFEIDEENITFNVFEGRFDQLLGGYVFNIEINMMLPLSNCSIPLYDYTSGLTSRSCALITPTPYVNIINHAITGLTFSSGVLKSYYYLGQDELNMNGWWLVSSDLDPYYTSAQTDANFLSANTSYYTEVEVDNLLTGKTDLDTFTSHTATTNAHNVSFDNLIATAHTHLKSDISNFTESDYVHTTGVESIAGDKTFQDDIIIQGDVWISGSATTVYSDDLNVKDNIILLNSGETAAGVTHGSAGIQIDRGTEIDQLLIWNENTLVWEVGESGSTVELLTSEVDTLASVTARGASTAVASTFSTSITTPSIIGGSEVGSNITYKSTTGVGTVAGIAHQWLGGTDGATVIATMLNNGYVGIGTDSPTHKLDVAGNININSSTSAYMYDGSVALKLAKGTDAVYTNTFVGEFAGNSSAEKQTALGYYAGYLNSGAGQTASGYYAGYQNTGAYQTASGYYAGYRNSGAYQTASGYQAGYQNTGAYQTASGLYAGRLNLGACQTASGSLAGYQNFGVGQTASGYQAGRQNSGAFQTALGYEAGYQNTGAYQTASGYYAGRLNSGAYQTASGYLAGYQNTGAYQTASGYQAGYRNSGAYQTASGYFALIYNDGDYNTAFGNNAFNTWTDDISEDVDAVLYESNQVTITGHGFGAVGRILNLVATTTDTLPTGLNGIQQWEVVGVNTLSCKTDTFSDAGVGTLTLTSNTIFTNSLALGNNAEPDASNQAVIGNSALTQVKTAGSIYSSGTGDNYFAGDVGIGTITSTAYLHIKAGTATASTAPLKLTTGINLTTPEAGTIEYDGCSFFITNVASQKAIDRTSDVALSTVTVQNTTGETTIWTGPMAANSLCAGNVFKFHANGLISSDSVGDLITIRIKVGGVTKATLEGAAKKLEDDHFHIDAVATQRTIGGSGSRAIHIDMIIDEIEYSVTSVATIDTTTNMDVTITAQWNNQDVGNILELYQGFMEYKN